MVEVLTESLANLHWRDFETLIDIIFARSGWHRMSALGGSQKTVDLEIEQPTTDEIAAVQVKSSATQKTLDEYVQRVDDAERFDRFFFVCHSPKGEIVAPVDRDEVHVWAGRDLAAIVLKMGLLDWVLEKVAEALLCCPPQNRGRRGGARRIDAHLAGSSSVSASFTKSRLGEVWFLLGQGRGRTVYLP
jgi:hypothetical protein